MRARSNQVIEHVKTWSEKEPDFEFNVSQSHLFSMVELAYSFPKRSRALISSIKIMLASDNLVSSVILSRALTETIAMGVFYLSEMKRLAEKGDLERLEEKFIKFYAGVRDEKIQPIHTQDGIRFLEKIDIAYFTQLSKKYPNLKEAADLPSVSRTYGLLSEIAHPNGTGTQLLFPASDILGTPHEGKEIKSKLLFACEASIWQCHHLVRALKDFQSYPQIYRNQFLEK